MITIQLLITCKMYFLKIFKNCIRRGTIEKHNLSHLSSNTKQVSTLPTQLTSLDYLFITGPTFSAISHYVNPFLISLPHLSSNLSSPISALLLSPLILPLDIKLAFIEVELVVSSHMDFSLMQI